jgi:hypothetical protein
MYVCVAGEANRVVQSADVQSNGPRDGGTTASLTQVYQKFRNQKSRIPNDIVVALRCECCSRNPGYGNDAQANDDVQLHASAR